MPDSLRTRMPKAPGTASVHAAPLIAISTRCTLDDLRTALQQVDVMLRRAGIGQDCREDVNLVLAEVTANVVRHGACSADAEVALTVEVVPDGLLCRICDPGRPFDPLCLGQAMPEPCHLNEGGYGWFLIHSLVKGLHYSHRDGLNILSFRIPDRRE